MAEKVSKSKFKPRALEYFRNIQKTGETLIILDRGTPVLKIIPYEETPEEALKNLRNTIIRYDSPMDPVAEEDWEVLA